MRVVLRPRALISRHTPLDVARRFAALRGPADPFGRPSLTFRPISQALSPCSLPSAARSPLWYRSNILAPAVDHVLPAPNRPDQLPQRALGPPDPESPEQGTALPVEPLPHVLLPLAARPIPSGPGSQPARTPASADPRPAPKAAPRYAASAPCRSAPRRRARSPGAPVRVACPRGGSAASEAVASHGMRTTSSPARHHALFS